MLRHHKPTEVQKLLFKQHSIGLPPQFLNIRNAIYHQSNLLINNECILTDSITQTRGVPQGNILSQFKYILADLALWLKHNEEKDESNGSF